MAIMLTQPWVAFGGRREEAIEVAGRGLVTMPQGQTLPPDKARPSSRGRPFVRDGFMAADCSRLNPSRSTLMPPPTVPADDLSSANADGQHVPNVGRQCCLYLPLSGHAGWTAGLDALNSG